MILITEFLLIIVLLVLITQMIQKNMVNPIFNFNIFGMFLVQLLFYEKM